MPSLPLYLTYVLQQIVDPEAEKPEDWDDDDDGEWEAPMIPNPDYKGEWKAPEIDNPEYKGPWEHPMIPNPEYYEDDHLYHVCNPCAAVGFELWQVQAGTIFDNILVTDSVDEAEAAAEKVLKNMEKEKKMWDTNQEEIKKKREEEQKISEFSGLMESSIAAGKEKEEEEEEESNGKDEL